MVVVIVVVVAMVITLGVSKAVFLFARPPVVWIGVVVNGDFDVVDVIRVIILIFTGNDVTQRMTCDLPC